MKCRQSFRTQDVVVVQEHQGGCRCEARSLLSGRALTYVVLESDPTHGRLRQRPDELRCVVIRGIVYDDELPLDLRLAQDGADRFLEQPPPVMGWDDDGYEWCSGRPVHLSTREPVKASARSALAAVRFGCATLLVG